MKLFGVTKKDFCKTYHFYIPDGKIYVGEITFTPGGGFNHYTPIEWDYKLGEMLDVSELMKEKNNA